MLILEIKIGKDDGIRIGDNIRIHATKTGGKDITKLHIDAPRNLPISRPDAPPKPKAVRIIKKIRSRLGMRSILSG